MIRSYGAKISITLSESRRSLCRIDVDVRVDLGDRLLGGLGLGLAHVGDAVDDLALQVRLVDRVEVHDAERADAGRGQVEQRRRAEAARAHDEHLRVLQALLPGHADVGDDQVARVALHLVDRQIRGRFNERWQRHCANSSQVEVSSSGVNRGRAPDPGIPGPFPPSHGTGRRQDPAAPFARYARSGRTTRGRS